MQSIENWTIQAYLHSLVDERIPVITCRFATEELLHAAVASRGSNQLLLKFQLRLITAQGACGESVLIAKRVRVCFLSYLCSFRRSVRELSLQGLNAGSASLCLARSTAFLCGQAMVSAQRCSSDKLTSALLSVLHRKRRRGFSRAL